MRSRTALISVVAAGAMAVHAAPEPAGVLVVVSDGAEILAMPTTGSHAAKPVRGITVEVSTEDGFRVYRASHQGRTYTVRSLINGPPRRFAFDPGARRFTELAPLVRVRLKGTGRLSDVAADVGALRHWNYPALDWAFLRLPDHANPAVVARRLSGHPMVERAEVQPAGPTMVPQ